MVLSTFVARASGRKYRDRTKAAPYRVVQLNPRRLTCDADAEEVLLFDDGISVKAQKPERGQTLNLQEQASPQPQLKYGERVLTDVVATAPGREYVNVPIVADGSRCSLAQVVQAKVQQIYADLRYPPWW